MSGKAKVELQDRIYQMDRIINSLRTDADAALKEIIQLDAIRKNDKRTITALESEIAGHRADMNSLRGIHAAAMRRAATALADQAFILSAANPISPLQFQPENRRKINPE